MNRTVRSRYRLAGFADEWVETSLRQLEYANLPPGQYTLEVEARSADGEWSQNPARMSLEVLPLWWETWWARLGAIGVLLLVVWYVRLVARAPLPQRAAAPGIGGGSAH